MTTISEKIEELTSETHKIMNPSLWYLGFYFFENVVGDYGRER